MSAVDDAAYSLGGKSRYQHRGAAAQISRADRRSPQAPYAPDRSTSAVNAYIGSEAGKLTCVAETRIKHVFNKITPARSFEKRRHKQRLGVGRKFGIRTRDYLAYGVQPAV